MLPSKFAPILPESKEQVDLAFPSEEACQEYLRQLRWPQGFHCTVCGSGAAWLTRRGLMRCSKCQRQCSITSGTIFERTRRPLREWLHAIWYVVSRKSGVSALGLQKELNLHSYQTAWVWLHRLRQAMAGTQVALQGEIEVGRVMLSVDQDNSGSPGRHGSGIVAIAVEFDGPKVGRVRLRQISGLIAGEWEAFLEDAIEPGASVHVREPIGVGASYGVRNGHRPSPVEYIASALCRWLRGTYCGAIDSNFLGYYLDEFAFRANCRARSRAELFHILLMEAIRHSPDLQLPISVRKAEVVRRQARALPPRKIPPALADGVAVSALPLECPPPVLLARV